MNPPQGLPGALWLVIHPNGERYFLDKEPLEGARDWAKNQFVTVVQYDFATVAYDRKPAQKRAK